MQPKKSNEVTCAMHFSTRIGQEGKAQGLLREMGILLLADVSLAIYYV